MGETLHIPELERLRTDLNHLYKTVYQGNGTPSLVTQIAKLEHRLTALEDKLDRNFTTIENEMSLKFKNITDIVNEKFNHISYQIAQEFEKKKLDITGRWNYKLGTLTASIAGVCSILTIIVAEFVRRL